MSVTEEKPAEFINTYAPEMIQSTVKKVWKDSENSRGTRPKSIAVRLLADGKEVKTVLLNEENGWTHTTEKNLPKYKEPGKRIDYQWEEAETPEGYVLTAVEKDQETETTTLTNTYPLANLVIVKTFSENVANRPETQNLSFTITGPDPEYRNGKTIRYSEFPNGRYEISDILPGTYAVVENNPYDLIPGYVIVANKSTMSGHDIVTAADDPVKEIKLHNEYEEDTGRIDGPKTASIRIHKVFTGVTDPGDLAYLTFRIMGPDKFDRRVTFSDFTDGWYTLSELPAGQYLVYEMNAATINANWTLLDSSVTSAGSLVGIGQTVTFELENNYEVPTTTAGVTKIWDDAQNLDGSRPASLNVTLSRDGVGYRVVTLSEANNWSAELENLPLLNANGTVINWTWSEGNVEGYVLGSQIRLGNMTVLRNTHTPDLTSVSVTKVWDDNNDSAGLRPATLRVTLSNGRSYTLSEANNWTVTVDNLPKYFNGQEIRYTWTEQTVLGYTSDVRVVDNVTVFTNHYRITPPEPPEQPGQPGRPRVPGTPVYVFEDYNTPLGVEVVINHVGDCFD